MKRKLFLDGNNCRCWPEIVQRDAYSQFLKSFNDAAFADGYEFICSLQACDVYVTECSRFLHDQNLPTSKLCIVICGESDTLYKYTSVMERYKDCKNVKFIGTLPDTKISFYFPLQNTTHINGDLYTLEVLEGKWCPSFEDRMKLHGKAPCFMRRTHPGYETTKAHREQLAKTYNVEYVNGPDKISIIKNYLINFCAENSLSQFGANDGYITEKVYQASTARCIPLYYGGDIAKYSILNPRRVLKINNGSEQNLSCTPDAIARMSEEELHYMYDLPILREDYNEFVEERKAKLKTFIEDV